MTRYPKNPKLLNRTKKIAATVAALGAAIGVSMGDVLAGTSDLQNAKKKSAISRQKIQKPDVRTPKVERALKRRPPALADKSFHPGLKNRPDLNAVKIQRPGLKNRPDVRADKSSAILEKRPGSKSNKLGGK